MLTERERKWLEERQCCGCQWVGVRKEHGCVDREIGCNEDFYDRLTRHCHNLEPDHSDAAEFEARVAKRVAAMAQNVQLIHAVGYAVPNSWWFLKQSRIAVEEENK